MNHHLFIWRELSDYDVPIESAKPHLFCNWGISNPEQNYVTPSGDRGKGIFANQRGIKTRGSETVNETHQVWP
jgi:hypothetical protein